MEKAENGGAGEATGGDRPAYKGWKVMPFVIGNEAFEKLGTIGTVSNMLVYLTAVFHIRSVPAAAGLNAFSGTCFLATAVGAFLSDTYLGRFTTLAAASLTSLAGMVILTLTASIPALHPPACRAGAGDCRGPTAGQLAALLAAFGCLVVGAGGIRPCNLAFGADQFDPRTESGRSGIASFFNWYFFTFTIAVMVSSTAVIYVQSNVSWPLGLAIPAVIMLFSNILFFAGVRMYVYVRPEGSPFTSFAQVFVAAFRKRRVKQPGQPAAELFQAPHRSTLVTKIAYTDQFRCLDKAAIRTAADSVTPDGTPADGWRLCSLQQVEQVKCVARVLPVWCCSWIYYITVVQTSTVVVLQALQSDRRLSPSFAIPAGSFVFFQMLAMTVWIPLYDRAVVPLAARLTGKEGGFTMLQRIGFGIFLSVLAMATAAVVEVRRRSSASGGPAMSCFWLVPQLAVVGLSEAFAVVAQMEFYYKQFPENMRSVAGSLYGLGAAVANYASGMLVAAAHGATAGGKPWIGQDLNEARLDVYYAVIAAVEVLNLACFVVIARRYRYKLSIDN